MGSVGLVGNLTAFILVASARQAVDIRFLGCELQQVVDVVVRHGVSSHWLMRPGPPRAFWADGCQDKGDFQSFVPDWVMSRKLT